MTITWEVKTMKKMSVKATQNANGGRRKCKYCGKKTACWITMRMHQNSAHWWEIVNGGGYGSTWCW